MHLVDCKNLDQYLQRHLKSYANFDIKWSKRFLGKKWIQIAKVEGRLKSSAVKILKAKFWLIIILLEALTGTR